MKRYKVGACGNFDLDQNFLNGQIIRSRSIMDQLEKEIGSDNVKKVSYAAWKKHPLRTLSGFVSLFFSCENVLLFPDLRAIYGLIPIAAFIKRLTHTKVYYNVIGGWLPEFLSEHPFIKRCTGKLDGLFVQTKHLSEQLGTIGIRKTVVFPNFKNIKVFSLSETPSEYTRPLSLVFMSRVNGRKGIRELVSVVKRLNQDKTRYTLDIYGSVQDNYKKDFDELQAEFTDAIRYRGQVEPLQTSSVMKDYFLHVFPTTFMTEGYPGSILDALAGGVPTLAARWLSYDDVLEEGRTGLSYTLGDWDELYRRLEEISLNPDIIWNMRQACLLEAAKFRPESIIRIMLDELKL